MPACLVCEVSVCLLQCEDGRSPLSLVGAEEMCVCSCAVVTTLSIEQEAEGKKPSDFDFTHFITLTTTYTFEKPCDGHSNKRKAEEIQYLHPEDEFYAEKSAVTFSWSIVEDQQSRWTFQGMQNMRRMALIVPRSCIPEILDKLHKVFT